MSVLEAATEWSTPPWVLAGDEDTLLWMERWRIYKETVARVHKEMADIG